VADKIPEISIIVPCYNQAQYLSETLESVLAQEYTYWECIIVNDGSIDNTEEISKKYVEKDGRFIYITQKNAGLPKARNSGINRASGKYILPLDADDLIHKDYIFKAIEAFNENTRTSLVYCVAQKFGVENYLWEQADFNYLLLLKGNMIFCSAIFRKSDFLEVGQYDELMDGGFEDWELWIRLLNETSVVKKLPETYFFYRVKSYSMNRMPLKEIESLKYKIYLKHLELYKKYFISPISLLEENDFLKAVYKNSPDYKFGNLLINPLRKMYIFFKGLKK
jgi:glycosyltransferase involved in cell wall biosynthesis